jgi:hypothetical protein
MTRPGSAPAAEPGHRGSGAPLSIFPEARRAADGTVSGREGREPLCLTFSSSRNNLKGNSRYSEW